MDRVSDERVRPITVEDLGIDLSQPEVAAAAEAETTVDTIDERPTVPKLDPHDKWLVEVQAALDMGFGGVILAGPPGTGKSYYAERVAHSITEDPDAVVTVQFHASYQYEDFMQGFAPVEEGGFALTDKVFVLACKAAIARPDVRHVIVIDEISRCDVARVFGEALTYLEVDKRGKPFTLASGDRLIVPANLTILATMNPWDKGVDELDVALERRFAQIDMPPDVDALRKILGDKGADPAFVDRLATFFSGIQQLNDDLVHVGHAYFGNCLDDASARRAWSFRLHPFFKKACRLNKEMLGQIESLWLKAVPAPAAAEQVAAPAVAAEAAAPAAEPAPAGGT
jgi:5-methylcytosine-specific restriction enzyme B